MKPKSCANCTEGAIEYDDREYSLSSWYECLNPAAPREILDKFGHEEERASRCPVFHPVMVEKCWYCHKPMNVPLYTIEHEVEHYMGDDVPCCSAKCKTKLTRRLHWEPNVDFAPWYLKPWYWMKAAFCWPVPTHS